MKENEIYGSFQLQRRRNIAELNVELYELIHTKIGSKVLFLSANDPENFFCLSFQTLPPSSNGIAHVLEHCVLCGSEKFPVKDPFFSMSRKSLNTYMNALTGADFTCYPAASQNEKDFYNLLEVYLDAVFHPKLAEFSFHQEGHRLSFQNPSDPASPLAVKGIVYNEMKGALSHPMTRLMEAISEALFPESPYGKNSGGDPRDIPSLTLEELRSFHKKFYDPSNCLFFFYGNLPLAQHLDTLERLVFKDLPAPLNETKSFLLPQKRKSTPTFQTIEYPVEHIDPAQPSEYYALAWLTADITHHLDCLALAVLDIILMNTDASLLKRELLASKMCRTASSSLDLEMKEAPYVLTVSGTKAEFQKPLQLLIFSCLRDIVKSGIPEELVEKALHQLELARSEIVGDGTPFGLVLYFRAALLAHHGTDPITGLCTHSLFDALRKKISQDPKYLTNVIVQYFLENQHYVEVLMIPSQELAHQELQKEENMLTETLQHLSDEEKKRICTLEKELELYQEKEEDTSCLPSISIKDISPLPQHIQLTKEELSPSQTSQRAINFYSHEAFTNHMSYFELSFPLPYIAQEELWLVRLFTLLLPQVGADTLSYCQLLEEMERTTGGIFASLHMNQQATDPKEFHPSLNIRGKCLDAHGEDLIHLLYKIATSPRMDERARIRELIEKHATHLLNSLSSKSSKYAALTASKFSHELCALQEIWSGPSYFQNVQELVKNYDQKEKTLLEALASLSERILGSMEPVDIVASLQPETLYRLKSQDLFDLSLFSGKPKKPWNRDVVPVATYPGGMLILGLPQQTASTILSFDTVSYTHPDAPFLSIAAHIMDNVTLHKKIREQGGAYGTGASHQAFLGTFQLSSFRDPHIASTVQTFSEAIEGISSGDFSQDDLEEAVREIIQGLDTPVAPGSRGEVAYHRLKGGITPEMRQYYRQQLLEATPEKVQKASRTHLMKSPRRVISATSKKMYEKERPSIESMNIVPHFAFLETKNS